MTALPTSRYSGLQLLQAARAGGYAVAAFNAVNLETAEAIVQAAEAVRAPVILQFSQNSARYAGLPHLAALGLSLKADADVPVILHFDHAETPGAALVALRLGFEGVMLESDDSALLRPLAATAHAGGGYLEAEYEVVAKGDRRGERHDSALLGRFAQESHCDLLAVDLGSVHKHEQKDAHLDFARLEALAAATPLPLVLHGASSIPDTELAQAAQLGIAKINLATDLTLAFTGAVRESLSSGAKDPRAYLHAGRHAMQARAEAYITLLGGAGRA